MCQCIIQSKISFKSHRSCDFGIRIQERQREIIWKLLGNFLTFILRAAQKKMMKKWLEIVCQDYTLCVFLCRRIKCCSLSRRFIHRHQQRYHHHCYRRWNCREPTKTIALFCAKNNDHNCVFDEFAMKVTQIFRMQF